MTVVRDDWFEPPPALDWLRETVGVSATDWVVPVFFRVMLELNDAWSQWPITTCVRYQSSRSNVTDIGVGIGTQ
jgi:hypothetical protein